MNKQIFRPYNWLLQKQPSKINKQCGMYLNNFILKRPTLIYGSEIGISRKSVHRYCLPTMIAMTKTANK